MAKIKTFFINGDELDVSVPANLSAESLVLKNGGYTLLSADVGTESDSLNMHVEGTDAKLRVGTANDTGAVRINAGGTTPNIQVGKMGTSDQACAALSCNTSGHGLLVLDGVQFDAASLSATNSGVIGGSIGLAPALSSIISVYETDWASISATANPYTFYVVLPDPIVPTRVKYTAASGLPDWEGDIVGEITGGDGTPTSQIPNVNQAQVITIGQNVTGLGDYAFYSLYNLSSVTIPASVTNIGYDVFDDCGSIMSITVDQNNPNYKSMNGMLCDKAGTTIIAGVNGDVVIPSGVTTVGDYAFLGRAELMSVTIPASVTWLGNSAFAGCISLEEITIPSTTSIDDGVFSGCDLLTDITMEGRTVAEVEMMDVSHWVDTPGCIIHCTDGDITV